MIKKILKVIRFATNLSIFFTLSSLAAYGVWTLVANIYIFGQIPIGGDWFNAFTYLQYFAKYLSFPASGWVTLANGGSPIIGGYPFAPFYIISLLFSNSDLATSMNYFSVISLILFCIASLALFYQISKNWPVAAALTSIVISTSATYYQLTVGGFIASASIQWFLPTTLFFIYKFQEKYRRQYLTLASIFSGIAILMQAPSALLMVFAPSAIVLFFSLNKLSFSKKIIHLGFFCFFSILIGAVSLYTVILQTFFGSGNSRCVDKQCWGDYPIHLQRWLNPASPIIAISLLIMALIIKVIRRNLNLKYAYPAIFGLGFFVLYAIAAYFKLIDSFANVIFPIRLFWAVNLLALAVAAGFYRSIQKSLPIISHLVAILVVLIVTTVVLSQPFSIPTDRTNTVPANAALYTVPKYQTYSVEEILPSRILSADKNWRIDIFNAPFAQWINLVTQNPITRGYSNHPLGVHQDWLYYLQIATRDVTEDNEELTKNRALFLLDAFGIKFIENSIASFPLSILEDKMVISKPQDGNNPSWYEVSENHTSPIISPTNKPALLFIGSDTNYQYFVKVLAMANLNSKVLIPVKGPRDLGGIKSEDLKNFQALFIYKSPLNNLKILEEFLKGGGSIFIDNDSPNIENLPEFFPAASQKRSKLEKSEPYKLDTDESLKVDRSQFSPFEYRDSPWNYTYFASPRSWAKTLVTINNQPVVIGGKNQNGAIWASGLNFPFHIIDNNNYEESKITKKIFEDLIGDITEEEPVFQVTRSRPEQINVQAQNISGIYFKENYDSGWKASVNGKNLKIAKAGLEFMYIPIPSDTNIENGINISYRGNLVAWSLFTISSVSITLAFFYLLVPQFFHRAITKHTSFLKKIIGKRMEKILEDEIA